MARTTGPILALGAITVGNSVIIHEKEMEWWQPVTVGLTAILFAGAEKVVPTLAIGLAWLALATVVLVRVNPSTPSPVESLAKWLGYT